jgi:hypothetical protein
LMNTGFSRTQHSLSLATMLSGLNAFEISDIQEDETEAALSRRSQMEQRYIALKPLDGVFGNHRT